MNTFSEFLIRFYAQLFKAYLLDFTQAKRMNDSQSKHSVASLNIDITADTLQDLL